MITLSLILPVHNQAETIEEVVGEIVKILKKAKIAHEILLIENGSGDQTWRTVRTLSKRHKAVRTLQAPLGYGSAVLTGLMAARGKYVSYMPSDGQADASLLPTLLHSIQKKRTINLIKIKRKNRENWVRYYNSKIYNLLANMIFHTNLEDINGSPRIMKRSDAQKLRLEYRDSFIDLEMAIKARYLKWNIVEIPAKDLLRRGGKSTVNIRTVIELFKNFFLFKKEQKLERFRRYQVK